MNAHPEPPAAPNPPVSTDLVPGVSDFRRHVPNILTVLRVVLAAVFVVVLSRWRVDASPVVMGGGAARTESPPDTTLLLAMGVFVAAALTDALDGFLARQWRVVSVFGRVMDPFADKVLVLGGFILLAGPAFTSRQFPNETFSCVEPWMAVVILARELLVTSLRAAVESRGVSFAATTSGKLKMVLQSLCVPAVLYIMARYDVRPDWGADSGNDGMVGAVPPARLLLILIVHLTVIVTAWSAVPYVVRAARALRK